MLSRQAALIHVMAFECVAEQKMSKKGDGGIIRLNSGPASEPRARHRQPLGRHHQLGAAFACKAALLQTNNSPSPFVPGLA